MAGSLNQPPAASYWLQVKCFGIKWLRVAEFRRYKHSGIFLLREDEKSLSLRAFYRRTRKKPQNSQYSKNIDINISHSFDFV